MKKSDVKQSLSKQVELHEDEKEKMVLLEVTEDQRDEVVRILADRKIQAEAEKSKDYYKMHLIYQHHIGNAVGTMKKYGPGYAEVPEDLVGHIQYYEQVRRDHELGLNTSSKRLFEVMQSGHAVPVKVQR